MKIVRTILALSIAVVLAGCGRPDPPRFSGTRTTVYHNGTEVLIVNRDGTYQQRVTNKWHKLAFNANRWTFGDKPPQSNDTRPWILLNNYLIPSDWCDTQRGKRTYTNSLIPTSTFDDSLSRTMIVWRTDIGAADTEANSRGRILMIDFYTDWCEWCQKMDSDVYTDSAVIKAAAAFVPLKVNAETNGAALAEKYHVDGYPTILFVRANGDEVDRITGYESAADFAQNLERISGNG